MRLNHNGRLQGLRKKFKSLDIYVLAQSAGAVEYTDCFSAEG